MGGRNRPHDATRSPNVIKPVDSVCRKNPFEKGNSPRRAQDEVINRTCNWLSRLKELVNYMRSY